MMYKEVYTQSQLYNALISIIPFCAIQLACSHLPSVHLHVSSRFCNLDFSLSYPAFIITLYASAFANALVMIPFRFLSAVLVLADHYHLHIAVNFAPPCSSPLTLNISFYLYCRRHPCKVIITDCTTVYDGRGNGHHHSDYFTPTYNTASNSFSSFFFPNFAYLISPCIFQVRLA